MADAPQKPTNWGHVKRQAGEDMEFEGEYTREVYIEYINAGVALLMYEAYQRYERKYERKTDTDFYKYFENAIANTPIIARDTLKKIIDFGRDIDNNPSLRHRLPDYPHKTLANIIYFLRKEPEDKFKEFQEFQSRKPYGSPTIHIFAKKYLKKIGASNTAEPNLALVLGVHDDTQIFQNPIVESFERENIKANTINYDEVAPSPKDDIDLQRQKARQTVDRIHAEIESDANDAFVILIGNTLGLPIFEGDTYVHGTEKSKRYLEIDKAIEKVVEAIKNEDSSSMQQLCVYAAAPGSELARIINDECEKLLHEQFGGDELLLEKNKKELFYINDMIKHLNRSYKSYVHYDRSIQNLEILTERIVADITNKDIVNGFNESKIQSSSQVQTKEQIDKFNLIICDQISEILKKLKEFTEWGFIPGSCIVIHAKDKSHLEQSTSGLGDNLTATLQELRIFSAPITYNNDLERLSNNYPAHILFQELIDTSCHFPTDKEEYLEQLASQLISTGQKKFYFIKNIRNADHMSHFIETFWPALYRAIDTAASKKGIANDYSIQIIATYYGKPIQKLVVKKETFVHLDKKICIAKKKRTSLNFKKVFLLTEST